MKTRLFTLIHSLLILISMPSCSQSISENTNPKDEIIDLMYQFQDLMNEAGFTNVYYHASTDPGNELLDEKYFMEAINEGLVDENTDYLEYAFSKIISSNLLTHNYKNQIKEVRALNKKYSVSQGEIPVGAYLTDSDYGTEFSGPLFYGMDTRENFEIKVVDFGWYKNGFSHNPEEILKSYDQSIKEVYKHFIRMTSNTTASYLINFKLIKKAGEAPRFIMDFVYSEEHGWQINNMYFDDYKGDIVKSSLDFD